MKSNLFNYKKNHMKTSTVKLLVVFLISTATLWSQADIQYSRPWNRDGINVFEPSKTADQPKYDGFKTRIGGSFTQDFQSLTHSNTPGNNDKIYCMESLNPKAPLKPH